MSESITEAEDIKHKKLIDDIRADFVTAGQKIDEVGALLDFQIFIGLHFVELEIMQRAKLERSGLNES